MTSATFHKNERIVSQRVVDELFSSHRGHAHTAFPVRAVYLLSACEEEEALPPVQVLMSVPKKRLRHAVDRNRVKRQLRECYRLNKPLLLPHVPQGHCLRVAFIWQTDQLLPTAQVNGRMQELLKRIARKL